MSSSSLMVEELFPSLRLDLERQIFETAALSRPVSIPNMMRVAWRVKVEPLLYRTLCFSADNIDGIPRCTLDTFFDIVHRKPAPF
ncbi:hypothetical protein B0H13DRAFT_2370920 [Mycena leptocephala]|nr:hypothetical protein B0H13DRAFT_2370920 [Mycena leptocephala]